MAISHRFFRFCKHSSNSAYPSNRLSLLVPCVFAMSAPAVFSETVQLTPVKDNTIYSENSNSNGAGSNLFAGTTNNGANRRALLAFDVLGTVPAGATIESVSLRMVVNKTEAGNESAGLHRLRSDWGEGSSNAPDDEGKGTAPSTGDATWGHAFFNTVSWSAGGDFVTAASATATAGSGAVTWSSDGLVTDVQAWVDGDAEDFGWILRVSEDDGRSAKRFSSRESGNVANRPTLTIDYTVAKADQTITFDAIPSQALADGSLQLAATATSELPVSFSVVSGPATVEGILLTFTGAGSVTVRASQAGNDAFNPAPDVDQAFEVIGDLDLWLMTHFNEAELLDDAVSGGNADPDFDGLPNDVEYALLLNPRRPSNLFRGEEAPFISENESKIASGLFFRNQFAVDTTIVVEESTDLVNWIAIATSVNGEPFETATEGYEIVEMFETDGNSVSVRLFSPLINPAAIFQRIKVVR